MKSLFSIICEFPLLHYISEYIKSRVYHLRLLILYNKRDIVDSLESQLVEKPLVLSTLVSFFEFCSYHKSCLLFLHWVLQDLLVQVGLVESQINGITSWHHMVVVDDLKERLDFAALGNFLFAHFLCNFTWILVYSSNQSMSEWLV